MPADPKPGDELTPDSAATGNLLERLVVSWEAFEDYGTCFTFVGPAGAGKTTLAGSSAEYRDGSSTLLVDAEAGAKVLRGKPNIKPAFVTKWQDIAQLTQEFIAGKHVEFKNVILDNLCEIQKQHLNFVTANGTIQPEFKEWNLNTNAMRKLVRDWRTYAAQHDCNVFFIGWDGENDSKLIVKRSIAFTPKLQEEFPGLVDSIGMINVIEGSPDVREIDFTPSTKTIAKFRRAPEDNSQEIPYKIRYGIRNMPVPDMIACIRDNAKWPIAKYTTAEAKK